jgi:outer membrane protein TolC
MKTVIFFMAFFTMGVRAEPLNFAQAANEMVSTNVDVRVQRTKLDAAAAQLRGDKFAFTPTLNLQAQQQNVGGNGAATLSSGVASAQVYTFNSTWNLFRSGADAATLEAGKQDQITQEASLQDAVLKAETSAAQALFTYFERIEELAAYQRSSDSAQHFLEIAQARYNKSLLSHEDLDKVALDAANSESLRADSEVQLSDARGTVESLLGHSNIQSSWPWRERLRLSEANRVLQEMESLSAQDSRPDVRAATAALEAESARRRSLFRAMLPSIDLTYTVGDTHVGKSSVISGWNSAATLTIPLWNGLKDYTTYRVQYEKQNAAEHQLQQLAREVNSSVKSAKADFRTSVQQYESRARNLSTAKHLLDQDAARFKLGRADANELNLDLKRVTEAEVLAIQGIQRAHMAYVTLCHVFGRSGF